MADRIDFVAEQVDSVGLVIGKRKDVDNSAAHRILPRFINELDALETVIGENLLDRRSRQRIAYTDRENALPQALHAHHLLDQRLGVGTNRQVTVRKVLYGIEGSGALHDARRIFLPELDRTFVGGREKEQPLFVQKRGKVVVRVTRRIAVLHHEHMDAAPLAHGTGSHERI